MLGRSRGHWEGDTLVIQTVDMRTDMWADTTPLTLSAGASVTEHIRKIDANTLENQISIRDPEKFTGDWQLPASTCGRTHTSGRMIRSCAAARRIATRSSTVM